MSGLLEGRHALITGGESGIGLATAERFVAEGARVSLLGLDEVALAAAAERLGPAAWAQRADVTVESEVEAGVGGAVDAFGPLHAVFSNAGISGDITPIVSYPTEVFSRVLAVHVLGAFLVLKHALPVVVDGGSVVITSSVVGLTSGAGISGYATAKHAQVGLMRTAAKEVAARGIRVNTIHPGPTDTSFQQDIEVRATGQDPASAAAAFERLIPLSRHAGVDEIAGLVLFLAGDDSRFITGATLAVDGGMSA
jgi:NAD(P)-dependent dehydrogenase (short-subunit alcohol dehydrogenase family)